MSDITILTTDDEITEAVAQWIEARLAVPTERDIEVARFHYGDGTGGVVRWTGDRFAYFLRTINAPRNAYAEYYFSAETVGEFPIIDEMHREAARAMQRVLAAKLNALLPREGGADGT